MQPSKSFNKYVLAWIGALFLFVQLILYSRIGIVTDLEAQKYITEGNSLYETGKFTASKYVFYLPVILLVYLCRWLGCSYHLVVVVQVLLSGLAVFYFFKLAEKLGNRSIAVLSSILLILFLPLHTWNFTLYTDSIFISLSIIFSYLVYINSNKAVRGMLIILLFLGLLILSRPHGLLFIPPTILFLLLRKQTTRMRIMSLATSLVLLLAMYFLLNAAFSGGGDMDAMKPFIEEHIICFVPEKPAGADIDVISTSNPVNDLFYYIFHNPGHFLRLMGLRLLSFFNMTRSYYSTGHNIALVAFMIPVYLFAIIGLARFIRMRNSYALYLVPLLVLYPLGATFQCDDWHSRFTMIVLPYLIFLAAFGFHNLFFKRKKTNAPGV